MSYDVRSYRTHIMLKRSLIQRYYPIADTSTVRLLTDFISNHGYAIITSMPFQQSSKPRQWPRFSTVNLAGDDLNDWCFKQYRDFMADQDEDRGPEILGDVAPVGWCHWSPRMATPLGGKLASLVSSFLDP